MIDRDILADLLMDKDNLWLESYGEEADYLLANGVIVLPCMVGDSIYRIADSSHNERIWEWQIEHIEIYGDELYFVDDSDNGFPEAAIGKTVFLTREEAEAALAKEG